MKTAMIATIPHSGTWMFRYFLTALNMLSRGEEPTAASVYAATRVAQYDFSAGLGVSAVAVDHNPLPGLAGSKLASIRGWDKLAESLGSLEYFRGERDSIYGKFSPLQGPAHRMVFVFRNPFEFAVTLARLRAYRIQQHGIGDKPPQIHPLIPTAPMPRPADGADVVLDSLAHFREGRTFEAYLVHYLSYELVRMSFRDRLKFVPYEQLIADREKTLTEIVQFLFGAVDGNHIRRAAEFSSLDQMKAHELALGHSFAGPMTHTGTPEVSHITNWPQLDWKTLLGTDAIAYAKKLFADHAIGLEYAFPELVTPSSNQYA